MLWESSIMSRSESLVTWYVNSFSDMLKKYEKVKMEKITEIQEEDRKGNSLLRGQKT
jgi:hypothetical protein